MRPIRDQLRAQRQWLCVVPCGFLLCITSAAPAAAPPDAVDLSLLVAPDRPCVWPAGNPPLVTSDYRRIGPHPFACQLAVIDEHTGTQWDAPAHFSPPASTGLPNAGPTGDIFADDVPIHRFVGAACVIDCRSILDQAEPGHSPLITTTMIQQWEKEHRPLRRGDVVLFYAGFSDKYYNPFPAGRRFVADPLGGKTPGWPAPTPACVEYLVSKEVHALGNDGPSMGPIPDLAADTHIAGAKGALIWTEGCIGLGQLPTTGAFYALFGPKHAGGSGGEARAIAIRDRALAARLNRSARHQRVADLSIRLAEGFPCVWPGVGVGRQRAPYWRKNLHRWDQPGGPYLAYTHMIDSTAGTHVVLPSYSLPAPGFDNDTSAPPIRAALRQYEQKHGLRKPSTVTLDTLPVERLIGPARVIDVTQLIGSTSPDAWPTSPVITVDLVKAHEARHGAIQPGDVVLFRSGHSDRTYAPTVTGTRCMADPLAGLTEGWPAPGVACIRYLATRGVRCIGTDAPSIGSTDPVAALHTYWAAGGADICVVEFLTALGQIPTTGAYFLFQPIKIKGFKAGHGRAIALF